MWGCRVCGVALLGLMGMGCDPGLQYTVADAPLLKEDGNQYGVPIGDRVFALFHAGVLIQDGHVSVTVIDQGDVPVSFDPAPTMIGDGNGRTIPSRCSYTKEPSRYSRVESIGPETITKNQREQIDCTFRVAVTGGLRPYPPEVRRISVAQPGFSVAGRPLDVRGTMVGD